MQYFKQMARVIAIFTFVGFTNSCTSHPKYQTGKSISPVNSNATKQAVNLLNYIYSISGKQTLTGQHNYLGRMSHSTDSIYLLTGKYPAIWGCDFGFSDSTHDIDNIRYRKYLLDEVIKQHKRRSIITLTYHQANPFIGEPCQFETGVKGKLSAEQWNELLTEGTEANKVWKTYMDRFAEFLKELQDKNIPVLFRPYHEMNGSWFWWGGQKDEPGFKDLWIKLYHYYTDYHHLNNLIWVWSPDKPWHGLKEYYPGADFVDIVSCDIYPVPDTNIVFRKEWYDELNALAGDKPIAIGECSIMPDLSDYETQPDWTWFMLWADLGVNSNSVEKLNEIYHSNRMITADKVPDFN